ncbi:MAG: HEPN domain-containing protein, partial [Alphaproteobacteria bacterium]
VILFGSYARSDWVDDPENGYQSDFDLLVVVSHEKLTDIAEYWYIAEDRILRDETIARQVNIIVHDLSDVNQALQRGEYFWADIVRDGIVLYELPHHPLATPKPLSKFDAVQMAERYLEKHLGAADDWLEITRLMLQKKSATRGWLNKAAFNLHQATESAYACFLLVTTFYFPRSHNIKFLRSLSEGKEQCLMEAWPQRTKLDRRRFELLKRAYVEARYSGGSVGGAHPVSVVRPDTSSENAIISAGAQEVQADERRLRGVAASDFAQAPRGATKP